MIFMNQSSASCLLVHASTNSSQQEQGTRQPFSAPTTSPHCDHQLANPQPRPHMNSGLLERFQGLCFKVAWMRRTGDYLEADGRH